MGNVDFKLNRQGVGELLKSEDVAAMVESLGSSLGEVKTFVGFDRVHGVVGEKPEEEEKKS